MHSFSQFLLTPNSYKREKPPTFRIFVSNLNHGTFLSNKKRNISFCFAWKTTLNLKFKASNNNNRICVHRADRPLSTACKWVNIAEEAFIQSFRLRSIIPSRSLVKWKSRGSCSGYEIEPLFLLFVGTTSFCLCDNNVRKESSCLWNRQCYWFPK